MEVSAVMQHSEEVKMGCVFSWEVKKDFVSSS